jgi:hypothetical protein
MTHANIAEGLAAARSEVDRVCELLVYSSPELLEGCAGPLHRACAVIAEFRPWLGGARGDIGVMEEGRKLRFAVRQAAGLLERAREYHTRWNELLGTMTGGYTGQGQPAPVMRTARVSLKG